MQFTDNRIIFIETMYCCRYPTKKLEWLHNRGLLFACVCCIVYTLSCVCAYIELLLILYCRA